MGTPAEQALLTHVLDQIKAHVDFLRSANYITFDDAEAIVHRLPLRAGTGNASLDNVTASLRDVNISSPIPPPLPTARTVPPAQSQPFLPQAKALWAYNEDGSEKGDLSFSSGEIVEIVAETNADWWTGRCRGREGIFPSNHVERLPPPSIVVPLSPARSPARAVPPPMHHSHGPRGPPPNHNGYGFPAPYMPNYNSPPPPSPYGGPSGPPPPAPYGGPPPPPPMQYGAPAAPPPQPAPEPKPSRLSGLKNTMLTSAAGGLGFGAGAAIGGDVVNSIF